MVKMTIFRPDFWNLAILYHKLHNLDQKNENFPSRTPQIFFDML